MRIAAWLVVVLTACSSRDRDKPAEPPAPVARPSAVPDAAPPVTCQPPGGKACVGADVFECLADGSFGKNLQSCEDGCQAGACVNTCAVEDVELVYVVDSDHNLASFDPRLLPGDPFHVIGKLACNQSSSPFSMAVDRRGIAWVLYTNGAIYRVSIQDAKCSPAVFTPSLGLPENFGMGFVTDGPKATTEKLFVAANDDSHGFARIDVKTRPPGWIPVGTIEAGQTRNPELTGTGDGVLYAYFPDNGAGFIQELDRATGKPVGKRLNLSGSDGEVDAWAFAHWGGVFYVFVTVDGNSTVHAVDRKTGKHKILLQHVAHRIVGAGVSTCAPLLEKPP